jgi:hypothetical protein
MQIVSKRVYDILKGKGVSSIYHASSVMTACSVLRNRCLLSPASADKLGLFQSTQTSAKLGRNFGIWDDVFTEMTDLHQLTGAPNRRGPVLFKLDIEIIRCTVNGMAWVTKSNPSGWAVSTPHERRWFTSANDLDHYFDLDNAEYMTLFRHCGGRLPIANHLQEVIVDDPQISIEDGIDCFSMAYGALKLAMSESGMDAPILRRDCIGDDDWYCNALNKPGNAGRLFSPDY